MINIKEIQRKYGFSFKESLGQNFFTNNNLLEEIVEDLHITKNDVIIEIGPGFGVLTEKLLLRSKKVFSIEIDDRLLEILNHELGEFDNLEIINEDFMKIDLSKFERFKKIKVIANIPYYITTPILEKLFKINLDIDFIAVMMQKEVGDRILAKTSTKEYGSLSVFTNYLSKPSLFKKISANNFFPKPKVDSVIIKFEIKQDREFIDDKEMENEFLDFVKRCFTMRRKILYNVLMQFVKDRGKLEDLSSKLNIDFNSRAENLNIDDFINIFRGLNQI